MDSVASGEKHLAKCGCFCKLGVHFLGVLITQEPYYLGSILVPLIVENSHVTLFGASACSLAHSRWNGHVGFVNAAMTRSALFEALLRQICGLKSTRCQLLALITIELPKAYELPSIFRMQRHTRDGHRTSGGNAPVEVLFKNPCPLSLPEMLPIADVSNWHEAPTVQQST